MALEGVKCLSKPMNLKRITNVGLGPDSPALNDFSSFGENSYFNAIWISVFKFPELSKKIKFA